ncbi:MAG: universal stress protein [Acidobacteria bacterium]|nr:universal stress protein [Acidobacteriota bacterium]
MMRRTPEELLRLAQAEADKEIRQSRGRLKVFLGYASGVGKSFRMFDEGRRRHERGEDVIVGALQPKMSPETAKVVARLEVIPLVAHQCMDVAAILRRRPRVCLVDGLAYDNPPGARNPTRWADVSELLAAGISVITTVNIQYLDEWRDRVEALTGKRGSQTVPQSFLYDAEEIVVVDAPAEGNEQALSELREMALLLVADVVDHQLEQYLQRHGIAPTFGTQERILVCFTPRANARNMFESGRRNADRFHGELLAAYVEQADLSDTDKESLERNLALARSAGAEVLILQGSDPIEAILECARQRGVTQVFVGHTLQGGWRQRLFGSRVDRLIRDADGMDVRVFPH